MSSTTPALPHHVVALLTTSGAMQTPHSGRTLFEHLHGTYRLLHSWGNAQAVCLGGLFHSIYGTNVFSHQSLMQTQRGELRAAIGDDAEALAWLFCSIDRPRAILQNLQKNSASLPATRDQMHALAEIECANLIEQSSWGGALRDLYCAAIDQPNVLSDKARTALGQGWARQLANSPKGQA